MARSAVVTAAGAVGFLMFHGPVAPPIEDVRASPTTPTTSAQDPALDRVLRLVDRHDCWTDAAPDPDLILSRAVITPEGETRARVAHADIGFAIWLDGAPGTLHAFCP